MWDRDLQALGEWLAIHSAASCWTTSTGTGREKEKKKRGKEKQTVVQSPALSLQLLQTPAAV